MAKTELNKKLDAFFEKCEKNPITEKIFDSSGLNIKEVNEYGNLLHASINYGYNVKRVLEFIDILLKKGINVNYKGKNTGLSFIHLALYGYTGSDENDHSYPESFIVELIKLAKNYGLDVNIKDNDKEDIATCAVASEIYEGSVLKIIESLGPTYELPENFMEIYYNYLEEAKSENNKMWYNRLNGELKAIETYVKRSKLNPEELEATIKENVDILKHKTDNLDYTILSETYTEIHSLIEETHKLISQIAMLNVDTSEIANYLNDLLNLFQDILESRLTLIEQNPHQASLNTIKAIAVCFSFSTLIEQIEEISKSYQEYLESLRKEAKDTKNLSECRQVLIQVKDSEIFEELKSLIAENMENLNSSIEMAKKSFYDVKTVEDIAKSFVDVSPIKEEVNYDTLSLEEINKIALSNREVITSYQSSIKGKVAELYEQLYASLKPLLESGLISQEEIKNIFESSSKVPKNKEKKK